MDIEDFEELFPPPFEIFVSCDWREWKEAVGDKLTRLRETLNEKYGYYIDAFRVRINYFDFGDTEFDSSNEVAFCTKIGTMRDMVGVLKLENLSDIVKLVEVVAGGHYQEIIDIDKENWRKMEMYEEEGNYRFLVELCEDRGLREKAFYYAKKWAETDSRGLRSLRKYYNRRKDYVMSQKITYKIRNSYERDSDIAF